MDSLTIYRQAICAVLKDYDFIQFSKPDIETQVLIDRDHDHYQLKKSDRTLLQRWTFPLTPTQPDYALDWEAIVETYD